MTKTGVSDRQILLDAAEKYEAQARELVALFDGDERMGDTSRERAQALRRMADPPSVLPGGGEAEDEKKFPMYCASRVRDPESGAMVWKLSRVDADDESAVTPKAEANSYFDQLVRMADRLRETRSRLAQVEKEARMWKEQTNATMAHADTLLAAVEQQNTQLREALQKYGHHEAECDWWRDYDPCTCGYSNALSASIPTSAEEPKPNRPPWQLCEVCPSQDLCAEDQMCHGRE